MMMRQMTYSFWSWIEESGGVLLEDSACRPIKATMLTADDAEQVVAEAHNKAHWHDCPDQAVPVTAKGCVVTFGWPRG